MHATQVAYTHTHLQVVIRFDQKDQDNSIVRAYSLTQVLAGHDLNDCDSLIAATESILCALRLTDLADNSPFICCDV
jgi:hypothetical protein